MEKTEIKMLRMCFMTVCEKMLHKVNFFKWLYIVLDWCILFPIRHPLFLSAVFVVKNIIHLNKNGCLNFLCNFQICSFIVTK